MASFRSLLYDEARPSTVAPSPGLRESKADRDGLPMTAVQLQTGSSGRGGGGGGGVVVGGGGGGGISIVNASNSESECRRLQSELNDAKRTISSLAENVSVLEASVRLANDRHQSVRNDSAKMIDKYASKATALKKKSANDRSQLESSISILTSDRNGLQTDLERCRNELSTLIRTYEDQSHSQNQLERTVREKESTIATLTANLKSQADTIEELTFRQQELGARLGGVANEASARTGRGSRRVGGMDGSGDDHIGGISGLYGPTVDTEGRLVTYDWVLAKLHRYANLATEQKRSIEQLLARGRRYVQDMRADAAATVVSPDDIPQIPVDIVCERFEQQLADIASIIGSQSTHQNSIEVDRSELETSAHRRTSYHRLRCVQRAVDIGRRCAIRSSMFRWVQFSGHHGIAQLDNDNNNLRKRFFAAQQSFTTRLHSVFGRQLASSSTERITTVFREWRVATVTRRSRRAAILRRLVNALSGGLTQAFNTWRDRAKGLTLSDVMTRLRDSQETCRRQAGEARLAALRTYLAQSHRMLSVRIFAQWRQAATVRKLRYHVFTQAHKQIRAKRIGRILRDHWTEWLESTKSIVRRRAIVDRLARMMVIRGYHNRAHRAFRQWVIFSDQERWSQQRNSLQLQLRHTKVQSATAIIRRWAMGTLVPAFHAWRATARAIRQTKTRILEQTLVRLVNSRMWSAWRTWRLFTEHTNAERLRADLRHHKHAASAAILKRWTLGRSTPVFLAWRQVVRDQRARKRKVLEMACRRLTNQVVWTAWRTWVHYIEQSKVFDMHQRLTQTKQSSVARLIRRWRTGSLVSAFIAWRRIAHEKRDRRNIVLQRTLDRLSNNELWRAWRTWMGFVDHDRLAKMRNALVDQKRAAGENIIRRWRQGTLVPVFRAWHHFTAVNRQHKRQVLERTCDRLANSALWRAFRHWREFSHQSAVDELQTKLHNQLESANRGRVKAMIQRWTMQSLAPRFHAWRDFAHAQRARKKDVCGRMLRRMENSQIWRAWRTWQAFVEHEKVMIIRGAMKHRGQAAVDAIVRRWRLGSMQPVFMAWRAYSRERQRHKRDVMGRMLSRLESSATWRAWRTWKMFIEDHKIRQLRGGLQEEKKKRVILLIKRWQSQTLVPCFTEWRKYARHRKQHKHALLERTFVRLENSQLWRAWRSWVHFVEDAKVAAFRAENDRLRDDVVKQKAITSSTIIRRWRLGSMQPVFHAWRSYVQHHRGHRQVVIEKTLSRMASSRVWRAWRTWKQFVATTEKKEATDSLHRQIDQLRRVAQTQIIRRWRMGSLLPAFHAWRSVVQSQRARKRAVMARTLSRMESSTVWRGWRMWRQFVSHDRISGMKTVVRKQKAERGQALISRWRDRTLVPVFHRWRDIARETRAKKNQLLTRMLNRMVYSKLWLGWRLWQRHVEDSKVVQLRHSLTQQKNQRGAALIRRWRMRAMVPTFTAWHRYSQERRAHKRELLGRTLVRLEQSQVWRAWRQWSGVVEDYRVRELTTRLSKGGMLSVRNAATGCLQRWRAGIRKLAFEHWRSAIAANRNRKRALLDRTGRRLMASALWRAWRQWIDYTEHSKVYELRARFNDQTVVLRRTIVDQKKKMQIALIKRWKTQAMVPAFDHWRTYTKHRKQAKRELLDRTFRRMSSSTLWQSWRVWRLFVDHEKVASMKRQVKAQANGRVASMIARWHTQSIVPVFVQWRMYVRDRKRAKSVLLSTTLRRLTHSMLWCAWRQWKGFSAYQQTHALRSSLNKQKHRTADMSIALWRNSSLTSAFVRWRSVSQRSRQRLRLLGRLGHKAWSSLARSAIVRWRVDSLRAQLAHANLALRFARSRLDRQSSVARAFHGWRAKMLAARLGHALTAAEASAQREKSLHDQLDMYGRELRELQARIAADDAQVADLTKRNSDLRTEVESRQRKSHTQEQHDRQKNQARAGFFRANILLSRAFRCLLEHAQVQKRKRAALQRSLGLSTSRLTRSAFGSWRLMAETERGREVETALAASRAQVESLLARVAALDSQLSIAAAAPGRESALIRDVESLNKKIDLLVAEVKERGHHIQFLIEENGKLSSLYQATGRPLPEGRPSISYTVEEPVALLGRITSSRSSSPARSLVAGGTPGVGGGSVLGRLAPPSTPLTNGIGSSRGSPSIGAPKTPPGPALGNEREYWPSVTRVARSLASDT